MDASWSCLNLSPLIMHRQMRKIKANLSAIIGLVSQLYRRTGTRVINGQSVQQQNQQHALLHKIALLSPVPFQRSQQEVPEEYRKSSRQCHRLRQQRQRQPIISRCLILYILASPTYHSTPPPTLTLPHLPFSIPFVNAQQPAIFSSDLFEYYDYDFRHRPDIEDIYYQQFGTQRMSQQISSKQLKLNVIHKQKPSLKISIIVGSNLTISHLKRKIETEYNQLYGVEVVIKVIQDQSGFIVSNNSLVDEHFITGDTIFVEEHGEKDKTGSNMNLASNLGEILSTIKFMTASALEKLDKIDLTKFNVMQLVPDLLHIGFWHTNTLIVQKLYKIYNKILGENSIQKFMAEASEIQISLLLRGFTLWLFQIPNMSTTNPEIVWELVQLIEKLTSNPKFVQVVKNHKLIKIILELSKDSAVSNECKKICIRIVKNVNGGGRVGLNKIKSEYIPSMMGNSNVNGYGIDDVLSLLSTGSPDEKLTALEYLAENNFQGVAESTVRFQLYEKMTYIFTLRKLKTKKHIGLFIQAINQLGNHTTKDQCIEIVQKDIFKKIHSFMLESPAETHSSCLQYLGKICKVSANAGMFNIEKSIEFLKSPYPQFVKCMVGGILVMSEKIGNISPIRFIPGIRDYITLSLKTTQEQLSLDILKIISNLSLDEQCRYQILNLKGIEVFVKFLETQKNQQICRIAAKGLLNLAISSRENKAKVLGAMNTILERYYRSDFDSITLGFIETIMKSKNI